MIYRMESGIDTEIKEKIITAALILATTVGVPALAATINRIAPYDGFTPGGQAVLGSTDQQNEEGSQANDNIDETSDSQSAAASTSARDPLGADTHKELELTRNSHTKDNSPQVAPLDGACRCLTKQAEDTSLPVINDPLDSEPEPVPSTESSTDADVNARVEVGDTLEAEARLDLQEDVTLEVGL